MNVTRYLWKTTGIDLNVKYFVTIFFIYTFKTYTIDAHIFLHMDKVKVNQYYVLLNASGKSCVTSSTSLQCGQYYTPICIKPAYFNLLMSYLCVMTILVLTNINYIPKQ